MVIRATTKYGQPYLKGKVMAANLQLWSGGRMERGEDFRPANYPPQINNMSEWAKRAAHQLRLESLNDAFRRHGANWESTVTFKVDGLPVGTGVREGAGRSRDVRFQYDFGEGVRLEIIFQLKQHNQTYQEKIRRGDHVPGKMVIPKIKPMWERKPKPATDGVSWIWTDNNGQLWVEDSKQEAWRRYNECYGTNNDEDEID